MICGVTEEEEMRSVLCALAALSIVSGTPGGAHAQNGSLIVLKPMTVEGSFIGKKKRKAATDISGIAHQ
jgi:hypothetical protein